MQRILYTFTGKALELVEVPTETEQGLLLKKEEKEVPIKYVVLKPTRKQREEADNHYAAKFSECIRMKIVTSAMLNKHYEDNGGGWSKREVEERSKLMLEINELQNELIALELPQVPTKGKKKAKEDGRTKEEQSADLRALIREKWDRLHAMEAQKNEIFNETAEAKAGNYQASWYICNLSFKEEEDGKLVPLFAGDDFETQLDSYDEMFRYGTTEQQNSLMRIMYCVSLWKSQGVDKQEDFEKFEVKLGLVEA